MVELTRDSFAYLSIILILSITLRHFQVLNDSLG